MWLSQQNCASHCDCDCRASRSGTQYSSRDKGIHKLLPLPLAGLSALLFSLRALGNGELWPRATTTQQPTDRCALCGRRFNRPTALAEPNRTAVRLTERSVKPAQGFSYLARANSHEAGRESAKRKKVPSCARDTRKPAMIVFRLQQVPWVPFVGQHTHTDTDTLARRTTEPLPSQSQSPGPSSLSGFERPKGNFLPLLEAN